MLRGSRRTDAWLLLAACAVYANALLWGVFQFDDYSVIVGNPAVHGLQAWWQESGGIRPLLKFSYALDWSLGLGARGYHFSNLLIHAANVLLVFRLTDAMLRQSGWPQDRIAPVGAAVALLFAVHPVHTEAVAYVSGRSSSLMALFFLGGMLSYLVGRQRNSRLWLHVATPLLFLAALAVKETAITFPPALLLLHFAVGGQTGSLPRQVWSSWCVMFMAAAYFLWDAHYAAHLARSLSVHGGWDVFRTQAEAVLYLLGQWWWPVRLNIDPDLASAHGRTAVRVGLGVLAGCLLLMVWRVPRRWPMFALGWLVLQLYLPYLVAPRIDLANERQLYLAGWPMLLALVTGAASVLSDRRWVAACAALAISGAVLTVVRNADYRSELALWQATARYSPDKSRVHNNLGYAYFTAGQTEKARRHYQMSLALEPGNLKARYNLQLLDQDRQQAGR